ncbi:hypothetical protein U1Q18_033260 [Sarracenia purpurea var. burkii]
MVLKRCELKLVSLGGGDEVQAFHDKIPQSNSERPAVGEGTKSEIDEIEEGTESDHEDDDASVIDDDNGEETRESAKDDDLAVHDYAINIVDNQVREPKNDLSTSDC